MEKINGILDAGVQDELRRRFNPDGSLLRKHQLRALEILKEVHDLCTRHGIRYYLCSGTLLGAVRHGGFIPWDDDVDIEMRWTDYLKFLKYAKRELKGKYKLQTHATDSNYFMTFAKVRDESTFMAEYTGKDRRFKYRGIFIDIFYTERILRLFAVITWRLKVWNVSLSSKNPYSVLKPVCTLFY